MLWMVWGHFLSLNSVFSFRQLTIPLSFTHTHTPTPNSHPNILNYPRASSRTPHPLTLKQASCHGNSIQPHIIPLSEFKERGSISDDVIASSEPLKSWSRFLRSGSPGQRSCVFVLFMTRVDLRMKDGRRSEDSFFSLQLRVEDEVRLKVPESPLHTVWEGWWQQDGEHKQTFSMRGGWKREIRSMLRAE